MGLAKRIQKSDVETCHFMPLLQYNNKRVKTILAIFEKLVTSSIMMLTFHLISILCKAKLEHSKYSERACNFSSLLQA